MFFSIGSIIIDDIVLPSGDTRMGTLGGGAVHAVMGMRAWTDRVGLVASVGNDFPAVSLHHLDSWFPCNTILRRDQPTPRAWQLFEKDGSRSEIFRTNYRQFLSINPAPIEIDAEKIRAQGIHLHSEFPHPSLEWIALHRRNSPVFILWEPWEAAFQPEKLDQVRSFLPYVDAVSPNLNEARHLTGLNDPEDIASCLLSMGAQLVALRMGENGSLVASNSGHMFKVPVCPVDRIVDVTGAGNAYCGGFIVGMVKTKSIQQAAAHAAVSASLALEQFGALIPLEGLQKKARQRLMIYQSQVQKFQGES